MNLFNLKKSGGLKEVVTSNVQTLVKNITVEDVHREFLTESDKILAMANEILAGKLVSKANRLVSLGFKNTKDVADSKNLVRNQQVADVIELYQRTNPLNKVITFEKVMEICKKYNLIYGEIERFKGFVPEKNLKEIENFKPQQFFNVMTSDYSDMPGKYSKFIQRFTSQEAAEDYIKGSKVDLEIENPLMKLKICAPSKDMIVNSWEKIQDNHIIHVPDPVVLYPIQENCFLIVTAWGEEASDPEVINGKMN